MACKSAYSLQGKHCFLKSSRCFRSLGKFQYNIKISAKRARISRLSLSYDYGIIYIFVFQNIENQTKCQISPKFSFLNDRHTFSFPPMTFWDFFLKAAFSRTHWVLLQKQPSELFLGKGVLKICCKFTGEHPCHSAILIMQLYRNRTSAWVLSCKFAAYF